MREYDSIELMEEVPELAERGIHKGYHGMIIKLDGEKALISFFNPYYHGERAYATTEVRYLSFSSRCDETLIEEMKEFFAKEDLTSHPRLREQDVKEYDWVELLVEKPEYAKEGVHKGMVGNVLIPYAIDNRWDIQFIDNDAELCVDRDDFRVLE